MNEPENKVHFTSPVEITKDANDIRIDVEYTGTLNDKMRGFYRSSYKENDGNVKYMASTQFEVSYVGVCICAYCFYRQRMLVVLSRVSMNRTIRQRLTSRWKRRKD